MPMKLTNS